MPAGRFVGSRSQASGSLRDPELGWDRRNTCFRWMKEGQANAARIEKHKPLV